jgi:hypothetical protein|tara:strand:- start:660 stop:821 length:162 start_codon:yes stop_codon:yes gene_type:complete
MSKEDMIQNAKDAKFQIEFMALMVMADRRAEAAQACVRAIAKLSEIIGEDSDV